LKFAFFAKSRVDYLEALKWLESHDETFSRSFKVSVEKYLLRIPYLHAILMFMIDSFREVQLIVGSSGGATNGAA
jgi:hypothetical protein